jgi:hypothetical protein
MREVLLVKHSIGVPRSQCPPTFGQRLVVIGLGNSKGADRV